MTAEASGCGAMLKFTSRVKDCARADAEKAGRKKARKQMSAILLARFRVIVTPLGWFHLFNVRVSGIGNTARLLPDWAGDQHRFISGATHIDGEDIGERREPFVDALARHGTCEAQVVERPVGDHHFAR